MIEKWRPAKQGDVGIVRVRQYDDANWVVLLNAKVDSSGPDGSVIYKGGWWQYCEVLVAYLDESEVTQLEHALSGEFLDEHDEELHGVLTRMRIGQIIREHFERGE